MSESCTGNCSTCSASCSDREQESLLEKANPLSNVKKDAEKFKLTCQDCGRPLKNKTGWFCDGRNFFSFMRCNTCKKNVFAMVETITGRDGKPRYKRKLRFVDKVKGL